MAGKPAPSAARRSARVTNPLERSALVPAPGFRARPIRKGVEWGSAWMGRRGLTVGEVPKCPHVPSGCCLLGGASSLLGFFSEAVFGTERLAFLGSGGGWGKVGSRGFATEVHSLLTANQRFCVRKPCSPERQFSLQSLKHALDSVLSREKKT